MVKPFYKDDTMPRYANSLGLVHYYSIERQGGKINILWEDECIVDIVCMAEQSITI